MKTNSPFLSTRPQKRLPFPRPSLPQAGESLRAAAWELYLDKFFVWVTLAATMAVVAAIEWIIRLMNASLSPWFWTIFAIILSAFSAWRWWRIKPQLAILQQAIRGEREVGRMLEQCRGLGYEVFHDIPGDGFNVDHALIGPAGVFAIETKTISKPAERKANVKYDGKSVLIDGWTPDRDPVAQAEAVADFLGNLFQKMASRKPHIRPVVLFPGWWVDGPTDGPCVWVLNPKAMRSFLAKEPARLSKEDIALFVDRMTLHLSQES